MYFLKKSKIYRLILCNVFFKMTHVLPFISAKTVIKMHFKTSLLIVNKIRYLNIVFSVFSFAKICQCTYSLFATSYLQTY